MRKIILCLALVSSTSFYSCGDAENEKKEPEEQQEFQQRPDYSKDTLSACKREPSIIFIRG